MNKIATDLEQSKKLAKILPHESADMYYREVSFAVYDLVTHLPDKAFFPYPKGIQAWSLSALLGVLPSSTLDSSNDHYYRLHCMEKFTEWYDNGIDACYEMICKLKERNLI